MKIFSQQKTLIFVFLVAAVKCYSQWGQIPDKPCYSSNPLGISYNAPFYFITDSAAIYSYNTIGGNTPLTTVSYYLCESTDDNSTAKNFANGIGSLGCCTDKQIVPLNKSQVVYSQNGLLSTKIILKTNNSPLTVFTVPGFENNFASTSNHSIFCVWKKYTFTNSYLFFNRYINGVTYSDTLKYYGLKAIPKIYFSSDSVGYIYGKDGANQNFVARTANFGNNWTKVLVPGSDLSDIKFENGIGYAVGLNGLVYQSLDNGVNWTQMPSFTSKKLNSVSILNSKCYVAGDSAALFHSYNFGINWIADTTTVNANIDWVKVAVNDQVYFQSQNKLYKKGYYSSVNEMSNAELYGLTIFPNPSAEIINLKFNVEAGNKFKIVVFDNIGREVIQLEDTTRVDIQKLASGIYSVLVKLPENKTYRGTFVKTE